MLPRAACRIPGNTARRAEETLSRPRGPSSLRSPSPGCSGWHEGTSEGNLTLLRETKGSSTFFWNLCTENLKIPLQKLSSLIICSAVTALRNWYKKVINTYCLRLMRPSQLSVPKTDPSHCITYLLQGVIPGAPHSMSGCSATDTRGEINVYVSYGDTWVLQVRYLGLAGSWCWQVFSVRSPAGRERGWVGCAPGRWWEGSRCGFLFHDGFRLVSFQVLSLNVKTTKQNYKTVTSQHKSNLKI